MKVTLERLDAAIFSILHNESLIESAGRPRACEYAALHCWIHQVPESEDTKIVREQLVALKHRGYFDLIAAYREE